ncbi:MAG: hypothetical protein OEZ07_00295 [Dehalococcoidia bacterium]|nr:hypothetical protein [Dehalococcoidia bacterium]
MSNAAFLSRLHGSPPEFKIRERSDYVTLFPHRWKCMVKYDDATAEAMKMVLIESKRVLQNLEPKLP